jgi:menaquinone-dependent protoporphyrinogen oxidase
MRTLIAYCSRYGTAAGCARTLAQKIGGEITLTDLARERWPAVAGHDVVLVGGSIYAGKIQRRVVSFCERNRHGLLAAKVGIFLCCLYAGEEAAVQMQDAFPDWLLAHAFGKAFPGGRILVDRLSFLDRLLVRALPHPPGDISRLRPEALEELATSARAAGKSG